MINDPVELSASTPFGIAAKVTINRLCSQMMANLDGTIKGEDIEALHDMRVASRRLRAAFKVFRNCFKLEDLIPVESEVAWVTRSLGLVRDQDVYLDFLRTYISEHKVKHLDWLVKHEEEVREQSRQVMIDALNDLQQRNLPGSMEALLAKARKGHSYASYAQDQVKIRLDKLMKRADSIDDPGAVAELHMMRIEAKRLRYTLEAFVPCFGKPLGDVISTVKELQELLGQGHDCDVWVEKIAARRDSEPLSSCSAVAVNNLVAERSAFRHDTYLKTREFWHALRPKPWADNIIRIVSSEKEEKRKMAKAKIIEVVSAKPLRDAKGRFLPRDAKAETAEHEKPVPASLSNAREALESARGNADGDAPRLIKQLDKLDAVMQRLTLQMQGLSYKNALKTEKRLDEVSEALAKIPAGGALSKKRSEKIKQDIRSLRKKLAVVTKK